MRFLVLFSVFAAFANIGRADPVPVDSLPTVIVDTVDEQKGNGVIASAETYPWGDTTVYKVIVDVDGVPALELHISEAGKLIRMDHLQEDPDEE
jgi:hypothetical protein